MAVDLAEAQELLKGVRERLPALEDEIELSPLESKFAEEFIYGEFQGNQWRSYQAASQESNPNVCSAESSKLMRVPRVRNYITALKRQKREQIISEYMAQRDRSWDEMARLGRQVILDAVVGIPVTERQLSAAIYSVNRVEGIPESRVQVNVVNEQRVSVALRRLSVRTRGQARLSVVESGGESLRLAAGEVEVGEVEVVEAIPEREAS